MEGGNAVPDADPVEDRRTCSCTVERTAFASQIEGTQASLVDLLAFEAEEQPPDRDVEDSRSLSLSLRLLNEAHK